MSIGTVNSVWAATAGDRDRPAVRVRRTVVTVDRSGAVRVGGVPRFAPVVTDFADLTRTREPVTLGGRIRSSADLVAAVATCLIDASDPEAGPVLTYPACYTDRQIASLQYALHGCGAFDVILMPEPVAAVEWLDDEYGVSTSSSTLVYDLGANSLDVAVVRTEAEWNQRGVLGSALRSDVYGGRPLGAVLARYARTLAPDVPAPVSKVVPAEDTRRLRTWHVRNSLRVVRDCLKSARVSIDDIDRVLLVGGAARPVEVAEVLAELGPPVIVPPDPAHTVATGAAIASARFAVSNSTVGRYARGAAVVSSAAVVSALAMSAATMIGGGPLGTDGPIMEFAPALAGPADALREQVGELPQTPGFGAGFAALAARADTLMGTSLSGLRGYAGAAHDFSRTMTDRVENALRDYGAVTPCVPPRARTYSDPARFTNPMPFVNSGAAALLAAGAAARNLPGAGHPGQPESGDQGTPPGGGSTYGDSSKSGNPAPKPVGTPDGSITPAPGTNPAPIGDTTATTGATPGDSHSGDAASTPGSGHSGGTADSGAGSGATSDADSNPAAGSSTSSNGSGSTSAESHGPHGDSANSGGTHNSGAESAGTESSGAENSAAENSDTQHSGGANSGAAHSGDATNSDTGTNPGGTGTPGDGTNPNSTAGDHAKPGSSAPVGGGTDSAPAGGAQSSPGTVPSDTVPGAGTARTPGPGAGTATPPGGATRPGATNPAPAAPVRPGVVAPSHPGLGATPGGGFHGGGLGGGLGGGFHAGGFGH
ncbi:Hsp70 family protein [Nocardia sp. BSTN01]|uniref:Hsp70 family protein n=1 Tax=Nocardia sp. BSTN01 TaxID=2783665 RepID=UPI00188E86E5|nr:Hsp70 family protein [Nocardia sp. BSTN01]MBF4996276.1 Hsp70 family protein [Nocardia sp. BSTN01]